MITKKRGQPSTGRCPQRTGGLSGNPKRVLWWTGSGPSEWAHNTLCMPEYCGTQHLKTRLIM
jgi:hypothetical protein